MFFELAGGQDYRVGNSLVQEIFIVYLTNGAWILFPFMCMVSLWKSSIGNEGGNSLDSAYVEVRTGYGQMGDQARHRKLV